MTVARPASRTGAWRVQRPLDLTRTLMPLRHGAGDPTTALVAGVFWRASWTPAGTGRLALYRRGDEIVAQAWGAGADWLLDSVPGLVGLDDDWSGLDVSSSPALTQVHRTLPGLRICRTGLVLDSLVPAILEQRVTGSEAFRAWRLLVRRYGEPAPGPAEPAQWVMPEPSRLLEVPSWDWHRFGVDGQRHRTVRAAATVAHRLEEAVSLAQTDGMAAAVRRLRHIPGVGEWTAAETTVRALGDIDAVSVGDFHVKNRVGWVLAGAPRSTDEAMVALLEPWRGQRARVVRLVELSGMSPPKYGPRFSPNDIRVI